MCSEGIVEIWLHHQVVLGSWTPPMIDATWFAQITQKEGWQALQHSEYVHLFCFPSDDATGNSNQYSSAGINSSLSPKLLALAEHCRGCLNPAVQKSGESIWRKHVNERSCATLFSVPEKQLMVQKWMILKIQQDEIWSLALLSDLSVSTYKARSN